MLKLLYRYIRKYTNFASMIYLIVLVGFCVAGFCWRNNIIGPTPDGMRYWDAEDFRVFLCHVNKTNGQYLYAITQATLDVVFPITYCMLSGIVIAVLFKAKSATSLLIFPLLAFICDLSENAVTIYLALKYDCLTFPSALPLLARAWTPLKWFFIASTILTIAIGLIALMKKNNLNSYRDRNNGERS